MRFFTRLLNEHLITKAKFKKIEFQEQEPVSVYWDLRTLLYLSIALLTLVFGILVYKNIDTIVHDIIIILLAILCATCFGTALNYIFK